MWNNLLTQLNEDRRQLIQHGYPADDGYPDGYDHIMALVYVGDCIRAAADIIANIPRGIRPDRENIPR